MMDCLFCKIAQGKIPASVLYEDKDLMVFKDIHPQAPQHLLVIPKKHIATIDDMEAVDAPLLGQMVYAAKKTAEAAGIHQSGYRLVFNVRSDGGQDVYHLHLHVLGGRQMTWPPG